MSVTEQRRIAEQFTTGVRTRDAALLASIMTDDVVWTVPGTSLMSGEARGVAAILERTAVVARYGVQSRLEQIVYGCEDVAVRLHNTGRHGDAVLDEYLATVFRLRDGRICRIDTFVSDIDMVNAYFR
jgi:ketosteroid isomerase-like protein